MVDISTRAFLQLRGENPRQGIRHLAPALNGLSLRSLITMARTIIHLSDLHIGFDNNEGMTSTPEKQASRIFEAIKVYYANCTLKPIIVITGDIVDYGSGSQDNVTTARSILDDISAAGFRVLVVPGNHDYSNEVNTDNISWIEKIPFTSFKDQLGSFASSLGCYKTHVSGITYDRNAVGVVEQKLLQPYDPGVFTETWKDKGAAFDLSFLLLDSMDHATTHPTFPGDSTNGSNNPYLPQTLTIGDTELAEVPTEYFLHDKYMRFSHGYIDAATLVAMMFSLDALSVQQAKVVVCMHHWINCWVPNLLSGQEAIAVSVLNLINPQGEVRINLGGDSVTRRRLNPNQNLGQGEPCTGSLWNECQKDGAEPVPAETFLSQIDRCHLLLVGHRHIPCKLQDLHQALSDQYGQWSDALKSARDVKQKCSPDYIQSQLTARSADIGSLCGIAAFQINPFIGAKCVATDCVQNINLDFDLTSRYNAASSRLLHYYHEAGSPVPDPDDGQPWDGTRQWDGAKKGTGIRYASWAELSVSLQSGDVSWTTVDC